MKDVELLDKAKAVTGSDSNTARLIGAGPQKLIDVRGGWRTLTPYQAAKIAEIIGERWYDVALPALAAKAKTPKERQFWMGKLETLRRIAVPASLAAFLAMIPLVGAGENSPCLSKSGDPSLYIMLIAFERIRRTVGRIRRFFDHMRKKPASAGFLLDFRGSNSRRQRRRRDLRQTTAGTWRRRPGKPCDDLVTELTYPLRSWPALA